MTDKKISELTSITGADVSDANDVLPIVDTNVATTKKITRAELFKSVSSVDINGGTIDGTVIGGSTPAAISGTTITATGDVDIADKIVHTGDTNTAIRFPAADTVTVETAGAERVRIDSSGNLLVGTTDNVPGNGDTNTGVAIGGSGYIAASATSTNALNVNRNTTDGDIAVFRKDGTTVGSIGATSGVLTIGNANTGGVIFGYNGGHTFIEPSNTSGASTDDLATLGSGTKRFRDLYLSGGVVFGSTGGTVTSKTLDDYEEGTWTPTTTTSGYTISTSSGFYTKVGRLVTIHFEVNFSAVGAGNSSVAFFGQPFASSGNTIHQPGVGREASNTGAVYVCQVNENANSIGANSMDGVSSGSNRTFRTAEDYVFTATYTTS